jgi:hypothetical protein
MYAGDGLDGRMRVDGCWFAAFLRLGVSMSVSGSLKGLFGYLLAYN